MKGLELSQRFFEEVVFPKIKVKLPECLPYMAAGMSGGSQCHGNDDEISRDHGWGPVFTVWLPDQAYDQLAKPLEEVLTALPRTFLGYGNTQSPPPPWSPVLLSQYLIGQTGFETAPKKDHDWIRIPEQHLFEITHRPLFYDGSGDVTSAFESFAQYPKDVWKHRLRSCLLWANEWGIKHCLRAEQRGDIVTTVTYWARFATYVMKVAFLLNHTYAPYDKWLHCEFLKLPKLADKIEPILQSGFKQTNSYSHLIPQIVELLSQSLESNQIEYTEPSSTSIPAYNSKLSNYSRSIGRSIQNPKIRKLSTLTEIASPPARPTHMWAKPDQ